MKKLHVVEFDTQAEFDRDDLLVMDDTQDLMLQVEKYFRSKGWCDPETGDIWPAGIRFYEAAAFDADGSEYEISLAYKRDLEQGCVAA